MTIEQHLAALREHPDYRILERLKEEARYNEHAGQKVFVGSAIDTETTGLDGEVDKIIELSIINFTFDMDGNIYDLIDVYSGFEDPGHPLSEEVKRVTGITDEDVKGQTIDTERATALLKSSAVIIAHNSKFDRIFIDNRFPEAKGLRWGCTLNDVDWSAEPVDGKSLSVLAAGYGFFFDAHRAETDVRADIHLMTFNDINGNPLLNQVLDAVRQKTYTIWTFNAPFDAKDTLKDNGYHWHAGDAVTQKAWHKAVSQDLLLDELSFLDEHVAPIARTKFLIETIDSRIRYSSMKGPLESAAVVFDKLSNPESNSPK